MALKEIARELYRLQKEVEILEDRIKRASDSEREALEDKLRRLKAERDKVKRTLEGCKSPLPYRRPR